MHCGRRGGETRRTTVEESVAGSRATKTQKVNYKLGKITFFSYLSGAHFDFPHKNTSVRRKGAAATEEERRSKEEEEDEDEARGGEEFPVGSGWKERFSLSRGCGGVTKEWGFGGIR